MAQTLEAALCFYELANSHVVHASCLHAASCFLSCCVSVRLWQCERRNCTSFGGFVLPCRLTSSFASRHIAMMVGSHPAIPGPASLDLKLARALASNLADSSKELCAAAPESCSLRWCEISAR